MKQLGNTLAQIAREKAGIVKPGVPVVCGVIDPEPQAVIAEVAREHGCRLIQLGRDFDFSYRSRATGSASAGRDESLAKPVAPNVTQSAICYPLSAIGALDFTYSVPGQEHQIDNLSLAMRGAHQAANAAVALATIAELRHQGWCISEDATRLGLSRAVMPGRVEVFAGEPTVVLDAAHNQASARALIAALAELPAPLRRTAVLSISTDKDVAAIVRELAPHFERFIVTRYQENPRAMPAEKLTKLLRGAVGLSSANLVTVCPTPADAWQHVVETAIPGELVCITGSFYLAAEMRPILLAR